MPSSIARLLGHLTALAGLIFTVLTGKLWCGAIVFPAMASTLDRVIKCLREQASIPNKEKVSPDASFVDDLGLDSLDTVELIMACEEEFGVSIPDEEAEKVSTVKDAVEVIDKLVQQ